MKRYLLVVGLVLILLMISCQMPLPGPEEEALFSLVANWGRTIVKTTDSEEGVFIHPTPDGGFVSLIETQNENTQRLNITNVKAIKLDANAEKDWVFSPDLPGTSKRIGVFILPNPFSKNGEYLMGIKKFNLSNTDINVELFYIDAQGIKIWNQEYPGSGIDILTGAIFTSEDTVMVYGKTNSLDGVYEGKSQTSGYDGFVLEIDVSLEGAFRQFFWYDYLEGENGIKRIYKSRDSSDLFFVGEVFNASGVQKIWLMRTYNFYATFRSQMLFGNADDFDYFFGGLRRTGIDEYVLAATKRVSDNEHMAFYKFISDATSQEMNIELLKEHDVNKLITGDSKERSIGFSHFKDGKSILAGVKATNDVLTLNRFFLINTETFEIREQAYQYRQGVIYNHLSKKGDQQSYGLTGFIPSEEANDEERTAGGRACWVEGLR